MLAPKRRGLWKKKKGDGVGQPQRTRGQERKVSSAPCCRLMIRKRESAVENLEKTLGLKERMNTRVSHCSFHEKKGNENEENS